jgi:hypothetical protein
MVQAEKRGGKMSARDKFVSEIYDLAVCGTHNRTKSGLMAEIGIMLTNYESRAALAKEGAAPHFRGFVANCKRPLTLCFKTGEYFKDAPSAGILLYSDVGTVFATRREAEDAVERTRNYASGRGLDWDVAREYMCHVLEVAGQSAPPKSEWLMTSPSGGEIHHYHERFCPANNCIVYGYVKGAAPEESCVKS